MNYVRQSERAARKATILQMATMYTVLGGTLLNLGVTFSNQGTQAVANGSFIGAGYPSNSCIQSGSYFNIYLKKHCKFYYFSCFSDLIFIKMQVFFWCCLLGPCEGWRHLKSLRKWYDLHATKSKQCLHFLVIKSGFSFFHFLLFFPFKSIV